MGVVKFLFGFIFGLSVGWTIGTLLAPASGSDTQSRLRQKLDAVMQEGRRAADERRAELEAQFLVAKAKRPAGAPPAV